MNGRDGEWIGEGKGWGEDVDGDGEGRMWRDLGGGGEGRDGLGVGGERCGGWMGMEWREGVYWETGWGVEGWGW